MGKDNCHNVNELYGKHSGDIYILGSGATLGYYDKKFFDDRMVIGTNNIYKHIRCDYIVSHHHEIIQEAIDDNQLVIVSKHHLSLAGMKEHNFDGEYYFYEHTNQSFCVADLKEFGKIIIAAGTPIIAAMQIACRMGAKNIILCGVDGGRIDGVYNIGDYKPTNKGHAGRVQSVVNKMTQRIRKDGVGVYSLLPFTNMTLEGHKFTVG